MTKALIRLVLLAVVCLLINNKVFGQAATDTSKGSIGVTVKDASGAIVPDAKVTVEGPMGAVNATTNDRGEANFYTLVPGTYKVRVTREGFATSEVNEVQVQATQRASVGVTLQAGQVSETVEVSGESTLVDTTSTAIQTNLNSAQYQNLPVSRNLTSLFYLAPGVASGGGTGAANPSISGASGLENQYIIDGINDTDSGRGGFGVYSNNYGSLGTGVNFDFVKEVQVKTGGFEAQYGQALGGIINVVTNSGGNEIHGSAYAYTNPAWAEPVYHQVDDLRTSAPQDQTVGQRQYDYGFNLGGPFIKDKFFWYGSFNPSYVHISALAPQGFALRAKGPEDVERRSFNWVGKLNYNVTDSHRLEGTAYADPSHSPSAVQILTTGRSAALLRNDADSASKLDFGTRNWAAKYSGSFGAATLLSASFAWNHSYFTETPATNLYQVRDYSLVTPFSAYTLTGGTGYLENSQADNKQYNAMLTRNVSLIGSHQFDIGYSYNDVGYNATRLYSGPQYALPAAAGIAADDVGKLVNGGAFYLYPTRVVAGLPYTNVYRVTRGDYSSPFYSTLTKYQNAFLQDAWQVSPFLTIKAGVRWEQQRLDGVLNKYTMGGNWSPRIGFIVSPTRSQRTKIFANWGYFFEKVPQDLAVRSMSAESSYSGANAILYTLPVNGVASPVPGARFGASGADPTIIYGGTKAQYQQEVSAGIESEITPGLVLRASFTDRTLKRGLEDTSGITVEQANAGANQQYVIQNPNVHSDTFHNAVTCVSGPNCDTTSGYTLDSGTLGPDGRADGFPDMRRVYNALEFSAEKRFAKRWSLLANYRLAKLFGNFEGSFRNDNGQSDPNITSLFDFVNSPALADQFRIGVLPTDRRHIVNLYGNYMLGSHLNFGLGWTTQSGAPISELAAHPFYGNAGEIPVGGRGKDGRTPVQSYIDLRAAYDLPLGERQRLRFSADMFNVGSRQTVAEVDQWSQLSGGTTNADFLKPLIYHRPFHAQFAVRYEF
jgi:hypothetical protein